jgi:hypothetical protein
LIEWLNEYVGRGGDRSDHEIIGQPESDWFYELIEQEIPSTYPSMDSYVRYVLTITVKDPKLATLFILRWA